MDVLFVVAPAGSDDDVGDQDVVHLLIGDEAVFLGYGDGFEECRCGVPAVGQDAAVSGEVDLILGDVEDAVVDPALYVAAHQGSNVGFQGRELTDCLDRVVFQSAEPAVGGFGEGVEPGAEFRDKADQLGESLWAVLLAPARAAGPAGRVQVFRGCFRLSPAGLDMVVGTWGVVLSMLCCDYNRGVGSHRGWKARSTVKSGRPDLRSAHWHTDSAGRGSEVQRVGRQECSARETLTHLPGLRLPALGIIYNAEAKCPRQRYRVPVRGFKSHPPTSRGSSPVRSRQHHDALVGGSDTRPRQHSNTDGGPTE